MIGDSSTQWWERRPGKESMVPRATLRQLREAGSWALASALCIRHPGSFQVIHSVPISGVEYDCLLIIDRSSGDYVHINRFGTGSATGSVGGMSGMLDEWMLGDHPEVILSALGEMLGHRPSGESEGFTPRDWTYGFLARFLMSAASALEDTWSVGGLREFSEGGLAWDEDLKKIWGDPSPFRSGLSPQEVAKLPEANIFSLRRSGKCVATLTTDSVATILATGEEMHLQANSRGKLGDAVRLFAAALEVDLPWLDAPNL